MPYNIVLSNGEPLVTLADGMADNSYTSLTLFGKNFAGYGQFLNENFVHLLENFSSAVPPFNPVVGQLWYDSLNHNMKLFSSNSNWISISGITTSNLPPPGPNNGDGWWDSINNQLYIWGNSRWILLGPKFNATQGQTSTDPLTIIDLNGNGHSLLAFYVADEIVGIWNNDPEFVIAPEDSIGNFPTTIPFGFSLGVLNVEDVNVSGNQINQGTLLVNGGITGNLTGDTRGTHYGDSNGTHFGNVTGVTGTFSSLTRGRVVFVETNGLLKDDNELTYNSDTNTLNGVNISLTNGIVAPALTSSNLIRGRITFADVGGLLTDDDTLTYDRQTNTLNTIKIQLTTSITSPSVISSRLTADRITFAGAGGLLSDDARLIFSSGKLRSSEGFVGDLTGNTNGTHTGPVIGNVTGNVTGSVIGNTNGTHTGPVSTPPGQQIVGNTSGLHTGWVCLPKSPMTNNEATGLYIEGLTKTGLLYTDALYLRVQSSTPMILNDEGVGFGVQVFMDRDLGIKGALVCRGDVIAFATSDRNLKTNIQPIENALSKLKKITGVCFDWTDEALNKLGGESGNLIRRRDTGVIAQDVEPVLPEVVATRSDGSKAVKYDKMVGLLIEAIKELSEEVEQLKNNKQ